MALSMRRHETARAMTEPAVAIPGDICVDDVAKRTGKDGQEAKRPPGHREMPHQGQSGIGANKSAIAFDHQIGFIEIISRQSVPRSQPRSLVRPRGNKPHRLIAFVTEEEVNQ